MSMLQPKPEEPPGSNSSSFEFCFVNMFWPSSRYLPKSTETLIKAHFFSSSNGFLQRPPGHKVSDIFSEYPFEQDKAATSEANAF